MAETQNNLTVKAKDVADEALKLMFHVGESGAVDEAKENKLYAVAPAYLTVLQSELAPLENAAIPNPITSLDGTISLSDETALKVMPCGLAMYFALAERDSELYNHFSACYYTKLLPTVKANEVKLCDCYLSQNDSMMR
jgi:hypothetical protein